MDIRKLSQNDKLEPFNCGDTELNGFLVDDAKDYQKQLITNTFVIYDGDKVVAYFSLLNDRISKEDVEKNLWRKIRKPIPHEKHFKSYPAIKLGRLGVSIDYRHQHIGSELVYYVKVQAILKPGMSACRFLTVDAYPSAHEFYIANGFKDLVNNLDEQRETIPMYFDLMELKQILNNKLIQ